ncbi:MAG: segregation/condensation protein A [Vampirovibrionales bacterium]|nr:segregation/condensation protein A [Vampirovibrionales bacterium]
MPVKPSAPAPAVKSAKPEHDGLEILLQLTRSGAIDPWNIDIAQVADEYLRAVAERRDADLKITGKTLLYLAILLRMKSDKLAGIDYLMPAATEDDLGGWLDEADPELGVNPFKQGRSPFKSLEELIQRRNSAKQKRIRRVTLKDLIHELKKYEALEAQRSLRRRVESDDARRAMTDYSHLTSDDIENLAHDEFIEDTIARLASVLERLLLGNEEISLTTLMEEGRIDKVSAFLALLFLAARGDVSMRQNEFYAELYVSYDTDVAPDALLAADSEATPAELAS